LVRNQVTGRNEKLLRNKRYTKGKRKNVQARRPAGREKGMAGIKNRDGKKRSTKVEKKKGKMTWESV